MQIKVVIPIQFTLQFTCIWLGNKFDSSKPSGYTLPRVLINVLEPFNYFQQFASHVQELSQLKISLDKVIY